MADPVERAKDVADAVSHPVETTKDLAREADRGRSARTPFLAITGVTLLVAVVVGIVIAIGLTTYFLSR